MKNITPVESLDIKHLLATKRWCYTIPEAQDITKHGGYVPSICFEGVQGHVSMTGSKDQAPWVWGTTLEEAQHAAAHKNKALGIDKKTAHNIVMSTMFPPEQAAVAVAVKEAQ